MNVLWIRICYDVAEIFLEAEPEAAQAQRQRAIDSARAIGRQAALLRHLDPRCNVPRLLEEVLPLCDSWQRGYRSPGLGAGAS